MEYATAQRRLVKSRPELWAQVSSEPLLARRLAEFGEIRITRVEPESTVAWEGDRASGTVELAPTGWGTKVILTATAGAEPAGDREPRADVAPPAGDREPRADVAPGSAPEPEERAAQPAPAARQPARALRRFLRRLFRRRSKATPPASPAPELTIPPVPPAPDPSPPAPGPDPTPPGPPPPGPVPVPDPTPPSPAPQPTPPPSIRTPPDPPPAAASAPPPLDAERTVAILTAVLDDLGADHRSLSRAS